jgi:hypothetical protein
MVIIDSVIPTAATASGPSLETKNTSTTAKTDSMAISTTMGTANRKIAFRMEPSVKSRREPRTASRIVAQNPPISACADVFDTHGNMPEGLRAVNEGSRPARRDCQACELPCGAHLRRIFWRPAMKSARFRSCLGTAM